MHELFDQSGQHALTDTAATKTAQKIRPKSNAQRIHLLQLNALPTPTAPLPATSNRPASDRMRSAGHRTDPDNGDSEHERLLTAAQVKRRSGKRLRQPWLLATPPQIQRLPSTLSSFVDAVSGG